MNKRRSESIKQIPDHPDYWVDVEGNIFSTRRKDHMHKLAPQRDGNGYMKVKLEDLRNYKVHRLVLAAFIGPRPEGLVINHIDGNKTNNALSNLEYVTYSDNLRHAIAHGLRSPSYPRSNKCKSVFLKQIKKKPAIKKIRKMYGERVTNSKLTVSDVKQIRDKNKKGLSYGKLAVEYNVSKQTIFKICNKIKWKNIV